MHVPVQACIAGCETGVEVCDAIAQRLGLPNNGPSLSAIRRNKYLMGEQVRAAGLRAVQQARVSKWEQVEEWLENFTPDPWRIIIKPLNSAGSDGVTLCENKEQLKQMFHELIGKVNVMGLINHECVVQEFLSGKEYVIDTVSRFGVHKVTAVWEYDKRPCNGSGFVYFGMRLVSGTEPYPISLLYSPLYCFSCPGGTQHGRVLMHYMKKVLDALNIVNSPGHGEVIMTSTGPCLVEVCILRNLLLSSVPRLMLLHLLMFRCVTFI